MNDIKAALREFIQDNFVLSTASAALGDDDSFLEHHVLDSTGFLELVAWLEATTGIKVGDDEMIPENLDSIASVARFVERKRAARGG
jgi:acyl carrier protein